MQLGTLNKNFGRHQAFRKQAIQKEPIRLVGVLIEWRSPVYTRDNFSTCNVYYAAAAMLLAVAVLPAYAQQGVVTDWSTHHVIFTNPGSEMDALMNGHRQQWQAYVNNPRYRMQQIRRSAAWANRLAAISSATSRLSKKASGSSKPASMNTDWTQQIGPSGSGTPFGKYPAVFANTTPSCSDFVVFPVNIPGMSGTGDGQANFVGFNNLYNGTCTTGSVPTLAFAFFLGEGTFQTSPVISLSGNAIAILESNNSVGGTRSNFHVVTLGTNGTGNGSAYNSPAVPHTIIDNGSTTTTSATNNAIDAYVSLIGNNSVTISSPFIDYLNDIAYVGDDNGVLHKITPVFSGTPVEVTAGVWPVTVASGIMLTGPVYDSVSGNIFVGGSNGNLYCIVASTGAACGNKSVSVAGGTSPVVDAPVVTSNGTTSWVFSQASNASSSVVMQAHTDLSSVVQVSVGANGTDLYNGDFDNAYYTTTTSFASTHLYFCGNAAHSATPTLWQVGFTGNGTMAKNSGTSGPALVSGATGTGVDCTPLTEVFNGTTDLLFLGVKGNGKFTGCSSQACIMSFNLASFSGSSTPTHVYPLGGNGNGSSGIVIDNTSTQAGASQIYFSNLQSDHSATQVSQSGLN